MASAPSFGAGIAGLALCCVLASSNPASSNNVFQDAWGVVSDPLKLQSSSKTLSDSLERTLIQLKQLEGTTNSHIAERLEQIRSILHDAVDGSQAVIKQAENSMLDVEKQVNLDAANLIYKVQCATDVTLLDTAPRSFASLISTLKKSDPAIKIFGIKVIDLSTNDVQIVKPDVAYKTTKRAAIDKLKKEVTDDSEAYDILSVYQNLELSAKFTICYYKGQALERKFVKESNEMELLSMPWTEIVEPDINFNP